MVSRDSIGSWVKWPEEAHLSGGDEAGAKLKKFGCSVRPLLWGCTAK